MINRILLTSLFALMFTAGRAQNTALDFTMDDCLGNMHHLYNELDQNNVVILEFFMLNCTPCITAGHQVDPLQNQLQLQYPGHIGFYQFGFDDTYTCSQITNWVTSNGFMSTPFDSGGYQVAYYGGFGMPTLVVVGGTSHEIIYSSVGYTNGDTAFVHFAIDTFFQSHPLSVKEVESNQTTFFYPNPTSGKIFFNTHLNASSIVYVSDISGREIQQWSNIQSNDQIDLTAFNNGIYFITIENADSKQRFKVIVNH